jgi:hypothetical protein
MICNFVDHLDIGITPALPTSHWKKNYIWVRFDVLTVVHIFWDVRPCSLVSTCQHFGETCCLSLQGSTQTKAAVSSVTLLSTELHGITSHYITAVLINNQSVITKHWTLLSKGPRFTNRQQYENYKGSSRLPWTSLFSWCGYQQI